MSILRSLVFLSAAFFLTAFLPETSHAGRQILEDERVIVSFDATLQNAASEVLQIYPAIRAELSKDLGWRTDFRPQIVLIKDSASFRRAANSDLVVAHAI